jgi:UDP-N-acetylmuramoyl-tripeptide--D-alanyl-D-alanine ligase
MRWTVAQVADALGVGIPPGLTPLARLAGVSIDSRAIAAGELFLAIHGLRHDGHDYVEQALERGALAAIVAGERARGYAEGVRGRCLAVENTLAALHRLARAVRDAWGRKLAGVTGSVGKTTTKEILAALLGARMRVLKSEGNLNNEYGLPLTLLRLEETHAAAVLEMGMSRRGELRRLAEVARPNVGVVTRIAPVHLEFFASVEEIALAKRELIEGLEGEDSVAVLNVDDPRVAALAEAAPGRVISYGFDASAAFRAERIEDRGAFGSEFDFVGPEGRVRLALAIPGRHAIPNALAALATASVWGVSPIEARQVFPDLRPTSMRGELLRFEDGSALINDAYNSNPEALAAMTQSLAATPGFSRRILAAGEMLELGPESAKLHREMGQNAAATRAIDWLIAVQGNAREFIEGAVAAGHARSRTKFFASSEEAAKFVAELAAPGDLLLVKGSRGVKMERIVEALLARKGPAARTGKPPESHLAEAQH